MFYLITRKDNPGASHVRAEHRSGHLAWLQQYADRLKLGGGFLPEEGERKPCGSILIIEADNLSAAKSWAKEDPYYRAGLFAEEHIDEMVAALGSWVPVKA